MKPARSGKQSASEEAKAWTFCYTLRWNRDLQGRPQSYLNVFPAAKVVAREREKLREMTNVHQSHTPIPELIGRVNRHWKGWANYFSFGYSRGVWWDIDWFVADRLKVHPGRRSQRPYRPPDGVKWHEHLQSLGLIALNRLPGKRTAKR